MQKVCFFSIESHMFSKCFKVITINKDNKRVKIKQVIYYLSYIHVHVINALFMDKHLVKFLNVLFNNCDLILMFCCYVTGAIAKSAVKVSGRIQCGNQYHMAMETQV